MIKGFHYIGNAILGYHLVPNKDSAKRCGNATKNVDKNNKIFLNKKAKYQTFLARNNPPKIYKSSPNQLVKKLVCR